MKKVLMFLCMSLLLIIFASCAINDNVTDTTAANSTQSVDVSTTEKFSDNSLINTVESSEDYPESTTLPVYVPGSVKLMDPLTAQGELEYKFVPTYRTAYYRLMGELIDLVDNEECIKWCDGFWQKYDWNEPKEMMTVAFVKHFNISREDFEVAIEMRRKSNVELDQKGAIDMNDERYELPNADIIYTFDNDIINTYYLRK